MDEQGRFLEELRGACSRCDSGHLALSGGLDSSAIAYCLGRGFAARCVDIEGAGAQDLVHARAVCEELGAQLEELAVGREALLGAVEETVRILGNFNDIEIRNNAVMYLAMKGLGGGSVITGDGADELFGGYDYMVRLPEDRIGAELERMRQIMHFPSRKIGRALGVQVQCPFLDPGMAELAAAIPPGSKIGELGGRRQGKLVIRRALEGVVPDSVRLRPKAAMQDGAGTASLAGIIDAMVSDGDFEARKKEVLDSDGVRIRSKESLHYYEIFRRGRRAPGGGGEGACPDCGHDTAGSRFCRLCGRFPV